MKNKISLAVVVSLAMLTVACGPEFEIPHEFVSACEATDAGAPFASDEAYAAFKKAIKDGTSIVDNTKAPLLTSPVGRLLGLTIPPTFTFRVPKLQASRTDSEGQPGGTLCRRAPRSGLWAALKSELTLERSAQAACPAFTGENYYVRVANSKTLDTDAYTAVLSVTSYVPEFFGWKKATEGRVGQYLEVRVLRAVFVNGVMTAGPFEVAEPRVYLAVP